MKRTLRPLASFALVFVLLVAGGLVLLKLRQGIQVTIENSGNRPLQSVSLRVTGGEFPLGEIAPGKTATKNVRSTGESCLEIEFIDDQGQKQRLTAGGYFEPGYRGTIRVSIKNGAIESNEQQIEVY
jgi:hypothetical protein